ncbi:MAG: MotA/TolQ/ExbB proton channel family protein [Opitutae bacterium]|jgi:biopolymer transport protein ExbB|nr:MotA/TolQ/ExbB proton channel family protein [Opitutae bacterium]
MLSLILDLWNQASLVWQKGGILMPVLAVLSLYTYFIAFDLWFRLRTIVPRDLKSFPRERWGAFQGGGRVNQVMKYCIGNHHNKKETRKRFQQVRQSDGSYLNRRLRFLLVLATASPLIGLLGTVGGMLRTFDGLSMQDTYKMDMIASGISEALVTTQAGLLVAIPALAFSHLLKRKRKDWLHCINRLESISLRQIKNISVTR